MTVDETYIHKKKYYFLLVSALSAFMGTLDGSIVNVSLPTLARTFQVSVDIIAWIVLAYSLAVSATLLLVGRLATKRGFRYIYSIGFGLFTVGSLFCGFSTSFWHLILSRTIQGIGASFLMASGPALITRVFPANERGKGMGVIGTVVGIGLMSGPPLGGFIVSSIGWRWIFLVNIPIGVLGFIYAAHILKPLKPVAPESRVDYTGGIFQAIAVITILLFLNRINSVNWPFYVLYSLPVIGLFALSVFLIRETRVDNPLVGLGIFAVREFRIAVAAMTISFTCLAATMVLVPFYLEEILHLAPTQVGFVLITIPIGTIIFAPISGRLSDKIGYRLLTTSGLALMAIGILWMSTLNQYSTRFDVIMRMSVLGVGGGLFQVPNSTIMMASVPRKMTPIASSLLAIARTIGFTGGVAVATAIFAYRQELYAHTLSDTNAFIKAFSWVAVAFGLLDFLAVIVSVTRKNRLPGNV